MLRNSRSLLLISVCLVVLLTQWLGGSVQGQGVLLDDSHSWRLPRPIREPGEGSYRIREFSIDASIKDQIATTQVSQTFENTGNVQIEASFVFPLPYDGAVSSMTFLVDGKEYSAKLLKADEARRIYEGYIRKNQDPALLEWMGQGMFRSSVFPIPPGQTRMVTLKYSQLLRSDRRVVDYLFPMSTARYTSQPIEKLSLRVAIESTEKLRSIYSPTHDVEITRDDEYHAVVRHSASQTIPGSDFRLIFDSAAEKISASLLSCWPEGEDQGYFVMLASPELKPAVGADSRKTVVFIVDQSGSMSGEKIEQAREAARFVINNLRKDDLFNIIRYESTVSAMSSELQKFSDESRSKAIGFVNSINSGGGTNIFSALDQAMEMIRSSEGPTYLVFLTDGLPTEGETNELKIAENCKLKNKLEARLITLGVGFDVNSRLLDRLSRENHGQSEYVRPNENIEAFVSRLYSRIASPVLANMKVDFQFDGRSSEGGESVNRIYPQGVTDMFAGNQIVMIGRYRQAGDVRVKIDGRVGDEAQSFQFDLKLAAKGETGDYGFIRQLWAARRIGEIIDLIDLKGKNDELVAELVELSIKHGIVTPYTSYLADENSALADLSNNTRHLQTAGSNLDDLASAGGRGGFEQRSNKQANKMAYNLQQLGKAADQVGMAGMAEEMAMPSAGGGLGGGGGLLAPSGISAVDGPPEYIPRQGVRKVGNVTLYLRGKDLVAENAASIDQTKDAAQIVEVTRYSDDYFKLVSANSAEENLILSEQGADEVLLVKLRGQAYRIK